MLDSESFMLIAKFLMLDNECFIPNVKIAILIDRNIDLSAGKCVAGSNS